MTVSSSMSSYIALSSRVALFNKNNIVVNNVANSDTIGYKKDLVTFKDILSKNNLEKISTSIDHTASNFKPTYNNLDFAIADPKHFFALKTQTGIRYTRAGNFIIDKSNILSSSDGFHVLSDRLTDIVFNNIDTEQIKVDEKGNITNFNGDKIGKIGVFLFENDQVLKKEGNSNFFSTVPSQKLGSDYKILQGFLEESNVNPIMENVELITTIRNAEEMSNISKNINTYLKNLSSILNS